MMNNKPLQQTQDRNKTTYQIKGKELTGDLFCFYLEKPIKMQKIEQPCYHWLFKRFKTDRIFCEEQFGISFVVSQQNDNGGTLFTSGSLPWYLFIERKQDMHNHYMQLEHIQWRLNCPDIQRNNRYFRHPPVSAKITSVSEHNDLSEDLPCRLEEVCCEEDTMWVVTTLFQLWDPKNCVQFTSPGSRTVPLGDFFLNEASGKSRLLQWLHAHGMDKQ